MIDMEKTVRDLFFNATGLDQAATEKIIQEKLNQADFGEVFFETSIAQGITFDQGIVRNTSHAKSTGFSARFVEDERTGFAVSSEITPESLKSALSDASAAHSSDQRITAVRNDLPVIQRAPLYGWDNPVDGIKLEDAIKLLGEIDTYIHQNCPENVLNVTASLSMSWSAVMIIDKDGRTTADVRPLARLNMNVTAQKGSRTEMGSAGYGGRQKLSSIICADAWKIAAHQAIVQVQNQLEAIPAPAGEIPVVLGPGWAGILLHEAIGHGLEGDFNRKKTSAFSGLVGQRVAAPGVTVVDDGTIADRRGSLNVDDEGTQTGRTVLIEDGILKGYMQDRMNASLMGHAPTGNGRRESWGHRPVPRMTNTFMLAGQTPPDEIIASVPRGIFVESFGGGMVDITNGRFTLQGQVARLIENGKLGPYIKGATMIGHGPSLLREITMIGNNFEMDPGIGTCGKDGQGVPVGVGQPTVLIPKGFTVGGSGL